MWIWVTRKEDRMPVFLNMDNVDCVVSEQSGGGLVFFNGGGVENYLSTLQGPNVMEKMMQEEK